MTAGISRRNERGYPCDGTGIGSNKRKVAMRGFIVVALACIAFAIIILNVPGCQPEDIRNCEIVNAQVICPEEKE